MTESTRRAAQWLLALGYAGGAVLIGFLLFKHDVDMTAGKTLASAVFVVLASFTIVVGARLARRPSWPGLVGALTVIVSLATLVLLVQAIWSRYYFDDPKRVGLMAILTLSLGGISLVLDTERPTDSSGLRLLRGGTAVALLVLALLGALEVLGVDIGPRALGVAGAFYLVGALSLPLARVAWSST